MLTDATAAFCGAIPKAYSAYPWPILLESHVAYAQLKIGERPGLTFGQVAGSVHTSDLGSKTNTLD